MRYFNFKITPPSFASPLEDQLLTNEIYAFSFQKLSIISLSHTLRKTNK